MRPLLQKTIPLFIAAIYFLLSPKTNAMTLPPLYTHEGLTIEHPLILTHNSQNIQPVLLSFGNIQQITVKESEQAVVLAETIVSPPPKKRMLTKIIPEAEAEEADPSPTPTSTVPSTPIPTTPPSTPTPTPVSSSLPAYATDGTLSADVLFSMTNQKRAEAGLPAFEKHPEVCAVAESRKPEIENEIYGNSSIHAGFRARNLPFRASENMISRGSETEAFNWWMNSSIHRAGILGESKYACVACQNKTCAMIFSSLEPK